MKMNPLILYEIAFIVVIQQILSTFGEKSKSPNPCPNNFLRLYNKCYYFSNDYEMFEQAKWKCEDKNSTLAVIKNKRQSTALREFLRRGYVDEKVPIPTRAQTHVPRWLAGQYDFRAAQWKWIYNGTVIRYSQFGNNLKNKDLKWHCLVIDPNGNYSWNSDSCYKKNYYICQTNLLNRQPQAANLTANSTAKGMEQNNDTTNKINSTEQHDTQAGFYVVDARDDNEITKKPKKKFICPKGYVLIGRKCYFLSRDKKTWSDAYYKCQEMKNDFARLKNIKQGKRLQAKIARLKLSTEKRWIGGYFDHKNNVWKWAATAAILPVQPVVTVDLKLACTLWDPNKANRWTSENCLVPMYYMCETAAKPADKKKTKFGVLPKSTLPKIRP